MLVRMLEPQFTLTSNIDMRIICEQMKETPSWFLGGVGKANCVELRVLLTRDCVLITYGNECDPRRHISCMMQNSTKYRI